MSNHRETHVNPPRRRLLSTVAGAALGVVGWKAFRRRETAVPDEAGGPDGARPSRAVAEAAPRTKIAVKPAQHSVKRHG